MKCNHSGAGKFSWIWKRYHSLLIKRNALGSGGGRHREMGLITPPIFKLGLGSYFPQHGVNWYLCQVLLLLQGHAAGGAGAKGELPPGVIALLLCFLWGFAPASPQNHHLGADLAMFSHWQKRGSLSVGRQHPTFPSLHSPFFPEHLFWLCKTCRGAAENRQRVNHSGPTGLKINAGGGEEQPPSPRISAGLHSAPPKPSHGCPPWALPLSCGFYWDTLACVCTYLHAHVCTCSCLHVLAYGLLQTHALMHVLAHICQRTHVHKCICTPSQTLATQACLHVLAHVCVHLELCAHTLAALAHAHTCFHALNIHVRVHARTHLHKHMHVVA